MFMFPKRCTIYAISMPLKNCRDRHVRWPFRQVKAAIHARDFTWQLCSGEVNYLYNPHDTHAPMMPLWKFLIETLGIEFSNIREKERERVKVDVESFAIHEESCIAICLAL